MFYHPLVISTVFETPLSCCSNCFTHRIAGHYSNFHKQQTTSAFHWHIPCLSCHLCKSSFSNSYWIPIAQPGRNSRLTNTPRLITKIWWESMKKLWNTNFNLPYIRLWTKKSDLTFRIIHEVHSHHMEVNQESTVF